MQASYVVRYGQMRYLGEYQGLEAYEHARGEKVVVQSDRGRELGEVLCPATDRTALFLENPVRGPILRVALEEDLSLEPQLDERRKQGFTTCRELIAKRRLQMDLVDVEVVFGGERIVFFYLAEKRVDFRELVRDLARVFQTRIEMRQIGVRDEAKLLADYGDCGKPVCCNTHLSRMPPVSMRMAKIQKTTLDPSKISGRCGRLKCCLRYEFEGYQGLERELPNVGARVVTVRGQGRVLALEILAQRVVVELEDKRRVVVSRDEIQGVERGRQAPRTEDNDEVDAEL
jgi:cell fate regulator YaaT (PSP1 superfamily)